MNRKLALRGASRRDFVKSILTASAALGLGPTPAFQMLDPLGGSALAQGASVPKRTVNIIAGTGALAWFTLLWPAPRVIKQWAPAFAYDDPAQAIPSTSAALQGRDLFVRAVNGKPLWQSYGDRKLITALVCGSSSAHASNPTHTNVLPDGVFGPTGIYAASAAIQTPLKTLVPVFGIRANTDGNEMPYGVAAGAPRQTSIADANAMLGPLSSAAVRLSLRLQPQAHRDLFSKYCQAFLALGPSATVVNYSRAQTDSLTAANFLVTSMVNQLAPQPGQVDQWCGNAAPVSQAVNDLATTLIITANAFKLGLMAQVNLPFANDDPHLAFTDLPTTAATANQLVNILESFMAELDTANDPADPTKKLSDTVIMTFSGDTPKNPFIAKDWPDTTPGGTNWIYVMSQGHVRPGWFGDVQPTRKVNFAPTTGLLDASAPDQTVLDGAMAAILFAVSSGDDRRVRDFTVSVDYKGLVNA